MSASLTQNKEQRDLLGKAREQHHTFCFSRPFSLQSQRCHFAAAAAAAPWQAVDGIDICIDKKSIAYIRLDAPMLYLYIILECIHILLAIRSPRVTSFIFTSIRMRFSASSFRSSCSLSLFRLHWAQMHWRWAKFIYIAFVQRLGIFTPRPGGNRNRL